MDLRREYLLINSILNWKILYWNITYILEYLTSPLVILSRYNNRHSLKIWDGNDESAPLIANRGGSEIPKPITSTNNELVLRFASGTKGSGTGFRIRVGLSKKY